MTIGASIFLIALGAVLAFAVNWHLSGLDLHVVGWILMLVGVVGIILFFAFWNRRPGRSVASSRQVVTGQPGARTVDRTVVSDTAYPDDVPPPGY
jgi:membrane protein implicated in regulation of membrane protease activity